MMQFIDAAYFRNLAETHGFEAIEAMYLRKCEEVEAAVNRAECAEAGFRAVVAERVR